MSIHAADGTALAQRHQHQRSRVPRASPGGSISRPPPTARRTGCCARAKHTARHRAMSSSRLRSSKAHAVSKWWHGSSSSPASPHTISLALSHSVPEPHTNANATRRVAQSPIVITRSPGSLSATGLRHGTWTIRPGFTAGGWRFGRAPTRVNLAMMYDLSIAI